MTFESSHTTNAENFAQLPPQKSQHQASRSYSTRSRQPPVVPTSSGQPLQRAASTSTSITSRHQRHPSSQSHSRQPSATRPIQDVLAHHEYDRETTNVATYSMRSSARDKDRDRDSEQTPSAPRGDHTRPQRRSSTKSTTNNRRQMQHEMAANSTVANSGGPTPVSDSRGPSSSTTKQGRGRTTIPTSSGKWILGKTIGAGSMGKVKLARKEDGPEQVRPLKLTPLSLVFTRIRRILMMVNMQVACKIIPRGSTEDGHHSRADKERADQSKEIRTAREAAIVTLLNHPHVCGMRDVVRTNYHWYMLFEYVNGGQMLDYIISHGKLKEKQARKFSRQIASALDYCHRNSIVHRDLKIENILISKNGDIKIIDFGLSNLFAPRGHLKTFCGSLYFAAPELLQARAYTGPEVDVWSFGIVLYVLRAAMPEVMSHPWMLKEPEVITAMTGFNFGSPDNIKAQLTRTIESEEYQRAVRTYQREKELPQPTRDVEKRRGFGFDFYKRRNSGTSRDTLTAPSSEGLQLGSDPLNAFSPLVSIYYLVREKQERDRIELHPGQVSQPAQTPLQQKEGKDKESAKDHNPPQITPPQAAHTNTAAYEMPGERATGGRSRPRARTHGEDDEPEALVRAQLSPAIAQPSEPYSDGPPKKESTAAGILRRFSTRRRREPERLDKDRSHPPVVQVRSPSEAPSAPRKSFSIRRSRRDHDEPSDSGLRSDDSQPQHKDLLSPPPSAGGHFGSRRKGLGRSTSVNSADLRRRDSSRGSKEPPPTSGSDRSATDDKPRSEQRFVGQSRSISLRAKSLGHARRESIQQRRLRREEAREANVPEETDQEAGDHSGVSTERLDSSDLAKPVFLKGLFSVSTTSGKSVPEIRTDIRRVLRGLGVDYTEIKGGFACRHTPSIDLKKVQDPPGSPAAHTPGHRRRFSFGGMIASADRERDDSRDAPATPRTAGRAGDHSYSNSDVSEDSVSRELPSSSRRAPGETSTQVQSDLGGDMVLEFEIFIVKVPLLSLHGIQFKRLVGNTWQYKNMADQILRELRL
ncbi:protein kinase kin1 [Verticillium dahliae VdLs.17]|uniref:non-specific serine/threonine protein kinase n=2 Tax=Verticillium TaxID=1036719 RepID=G2XIR0_VERDV|nr:protein kinase kin1 [Verticillium dahliae VdLs.17]EGY20479.1 protein kinase kin1 [Verticillium dahliae VdLs.17]